MQRLLDTKELTRLLNLGVNTLHTWRWMGKGPKFIRLGNRRVLYDIKDVEEWMAANTIELENPSGSPCPHCGQPMRRPHG